MRNPWVHLHSGISDERRWVELISNSTFLTSLKCKMHGIVCETDLFQKVVESKKESLVSSRGWILDPFQTILHCTNLVR